MSKEKFYKCIPELNKECKKSNCFINGGECENTIYNEYTLKGLLEKIERLNNIINELEKWLDAEIKRINDIKEGKGSKVKPYGEEKNNYQIMISGYKYCLNKLQELKGSDK